MKPIVPFLVVSAAFAFFFCQGQQPGRSAAKTPLPPETSAQWALLPFEKLDSANPVLQPGTGSFIDPILQSPVLWEAKDVFNPAIVRKDRKIYMLYRAQDRTGKPAGTSRIGLAISGDGIHFRRRKSPVLYPENDRWKRYEWEGGCEDPRVVKTGDGRYFMTYTAFDGHQARLFVASSVDLVHWRKYGSAFAKAYGGRYADKWSKSGSIVSEYRDGQAVAVKINGKYWMYWGDEQIWIATSTDMINWSPVEMSAGEKAPVALRGQSLTMPRLKICLPTRSGKFDSDLVESGPPAMRTNAGIVLIYNSRNVPAIGDKSLPLGTYAPSEALFDKNDPTRLIARMNNWIMKPDKPYERTGQVGQVCFAEGLAALNHQWYLYYGTADSRIAVAVSPQR